MSICRVQLDRFKKQNRISGQKEAKPQNRTSLSPSVGRYRPDSTLSSLHENRLSDNLNKTLEISESSAANRESLSTIASPASSSFNFEASQNISRQSRVSSVLSEADSQLTIRSETTNARRANRLTIESSIAEI